MNDNNRQNSTNINWYPGHMAKTKRLIKENLEQIDIVYEVVDARMPYSSKIRDLDDIIKNKPKIMILTKYDLCDKLETKRWITYYEKQNYHVIAMDIEHQFEKKQILQLTENLLEEKWKKLKEKGLLRKRARALVVGIPNVGKSTLINRLVGKNVVGTGNRPGVTKELNWIRISDTVELLDSPGILWPKIDIGNVAYNLASLTAIKEEILPLFDVTEYILRTLENYYPNILKERYGIEKVDEDVIETMEFIGKRRGCLVKGGEIDYDKVIAIIMNDVKNGIIKNITFDRIEELNESK
ncbi:MAG: ribosome biogenesis GTPase YlqF [Bacilli bacterium]|jgi:ribosome biogenesis GTPase A|nr:ribosome biogenesis GTPase YlqF [Bacilli bacterium]